MTDVAEIEHTDAQNRAEELHLQGMEASDAGDEDRALALYMQALELDFSRPTTLYNIGLIFKYRSDWEKSRRFNKRAAELAPDDEASNWNLGIAATALRDWPLARWAWAQAGIQVGEGEGPIEGRFGTACVRLNPDDEPEVVWAQRICPVRARITNIPYPESGFGYGDIVLHDGASTGRRVHEDREYPVFNVLEAFEDSPFSTFKADIAIGSDDDVTALRKLSDAAQVEFEDWTYSVSMICKGCSEGTTHTDHKPVEDPRWQHRRRVAFAAIEEDAVRAVLEQWQDDVRRVETFDCALSPG
jgi:hypothetical protein